MSTIYLGAPRIGYRSAEIVLHYATFGIPLERVETFTVSYHAARNFCIMPPSVSQFYPVVADVLDKPFNDDDLQYTHLTDRDLAACKVLGTGWYSYEAVAFKRCGLCDHTLHRLAWLRPAPDNTSVLIHPTHDRALTIDEHNALTDNTAIHAWLAEQFAAYHRDAWGAQDWESKYNAATSTWEGGSVPGKQIKRFDLTQYRGYCFDADRWEKYVNSRRL